MQFSGGPAGAAIAQMPTLPRALRKAGYTTLGLGSESGLGLGNPNPKPNSNLNQVHDGLLRQVAHGAARKDGELRRRGVRRAKRE